MAERWTAKEWAVRMVESERRPAEVAQEVGCSVSAIRNWRNVPIVLIGRTKRVG